MLTPVKMSSWDSGLRQSGFFPAPSACKSEDQAGQKEDRINGELLNLNSTLSLLPVRQRGSSHGA